MSYLDSELSGGAVTGAMSYLDSELSGGAVSGAESLEEMGEDLRDGVSA